MFKWSDHIAETMIDLTDICKKARHARDRQNLKDALDGSKPVRPVVNPVVSTVQLAGQVNEGPSVSRPTPKKPGKKAAHPHEDGDGCIMCGPEECSVTERLLSDVEPQMQDSSFAFAKNVVASLKHRPSISNSHPATIQAGDTSAAVVPVSPYEPPAIVFGEAKTESDVLVEVKSDAVASKEVSVPPVPPTAKEVDGEQQESGADGSDAEEDEGEDEKETDPLTAAKETLASIKKLLGIEDEVTPQDGIWLDMHKTNMKTKKREFRGKVLFSLEVLPKADADKFPAGFGREAPNSNPFLPPPSGRLKFVRSWSCGCGVGHDRTSVFSFVFAHSELESVQNDVPVSGAWPVLQAVLLSHFCSHCVCLHLLGPFSQRHDYVVSGPFSSPLEPR